MIQLRQSVAFKDDKIWVQRGLYTWLDSGKAGLLKMCQIRQSVAFEDDKIWVKRGHSTPLY